MVILKKIRNNILVNEMHFDILSKCQYTYAHKLSKQVTATWSSTITILKEFEELGLIYKFKQGRVFIIDLTDKGKTLIKFYQESLKPLIKSANDVNDVVNANLIDEDKIKQAEAMEEDFNEQEISNNK